jgi:Uma2 family endonuclease
MMEEMRVATLLSVEEYLNTSFDPDCDFIDGEVVERNVGKRKHAYAQTKVSVWFSQPRGKMQLQPLTELRVQVGPRTIRIPDVVVSKTPLPEEEVFTSPSYLFIEIMSPEDTIAGMQDRIDDYLEFGVPNIWVIDPWKHRGWRVSAEGWATATDGIMRTSDNRIAMPLKDVLLP